MFQVLFTIRLSALYDGLPDVPIYGYGLMLFFAFVVNLWLGVRLARREGIRREVLENLGIWIFVTGILGARVTYFLYFRDTFDWRAFFAIWDGGLVFYGSIFGAIIGFFLVYPFFLRPKGISGWKLIDVLAPCAALGLCLGRIGCLLNGCCYGNVACADCHAIHFPLAAAPRIDMTARGHQTAAGFTMKDTQAAYVDRVEPHSPAAGGLEPEDKADFLQPGDKIVAVKLDDREEPVKILVSSDLANVMGSLGWPRGKNDLQLTVERQGQEKVLKPFTPRGIGLHPTQIYESISMGLMTFLLLSYYPFKRRDGMVMVVMMIGYAIHRFLNEMLRTDTPPLAFGMTLSQNISILMLILSAILYLFIRLNPPRPPLVNEPGGASLVPAGP